MDQSVQVYAIEINNDLVSLNATKNAAGIQDSDVIYSSFFSFTFQIG